jgi:uncharacterized protein YbjT (DUF2867 family)
MPSSKIFITGGTGYIGKRLIGRLLMKGYEVYALVRKGAEKKLPPRCHIIFGNALEASSFSEAIPGDCQFIHLVGVAHPSPSKRQQFIDIDLASVHASVKAVNGKNIRQFIYMSVAPSKIMQDYSDVRMQGEKLIRENIPDSTFIRPFYVLGPGHYWPLVLTPLFFLLSLSPGGKEKAQRLGLVWIGQIINTLTDAIENPALGNRIIEVSGIRKFSRKF